MDFKKHILIIAFILIIGLNGFSQKVGYEWVKTIDSSGFVYTAIDNESNIIVATKDHIQKFDSLGNLLWLTQDTMSSISGISVDNMGNIYVTGTYVKFLTQSQYSYTANSFVFLEKYNSNGNRIWVSVSNIKTLTNNDKFNYSYSVACDLNNGIYITGSYSESLTFDSIHLVCNNSSAIFLAKYDSSGSVQWVKNINGTNSNDALSYGQGNDIGIDYNNNIYLTGSFRGPFQFGNSTIQCNMGSGDIFLSKIDVNGSFLYTYAYGGTNTDEGCRIAIDRNNDIALMAKFGDVININGSNYQAVNNYNNPIIIRFRNDSISTVTPIGKSSNGGSILSDICFDINHNVIYGGWTNFEHLKPMLYKIDSSGIINWYYEVADCSLSTTANVYSIVSDSSGIYIAGSNSNNVCFGDTLLGTTNNPPHTYLGKIDTTNTYPLFITTNTKSSLYNVFPNPTDDQLSIMSLNKSLTSNTINLYDIEGKLINSYIMDNYIVTISLHHLKSGVYFLEIINGNYSEQKKIIKY